MMKHRCLAIALLGVCSALMLPLMQAHAHSAPIPGASLEACDARAKSDACEYKGQHGERYIGTCQWMAESLMCVRNKPIVWPDSEEHGHSHDASEAKDPKAVADDHSH
ncbi:hypothetical protein Q4485_00365 [Granulosicoccaceae sp. 1_MG-2023]|nr:hypothetical protein [Granulosicoccaceae sp. 1_MG-2023]